MTEWLNQLSGETGVPEELLKKFVVGLLLLVGLWVARRVGVRVEHMADKTDGGSRTFAPALGKAVQIGLSVIIVIAGLGALGVDTSGLLAALAASGLATIRALKGVFMPVVQVQVGYARSRSRDPAPMRWRRLDLWRGPSDLRREMSSCMSDMR